MNEFDDHIRLKNSGLNVDSNPDLCDAGAVLHQLTTGSRSLCGSIIRPCHMAAILSRETRKALFYHAVETMGVRLGVVKQAFLVSRDNMAAV